MPVAAVFRGDTDDMRDLARAIEHNCTCDPAAVTRGCAAHQALLDQRFVDGLLFARYLLERLMAGEWR